LQVARIPDGDKIEVLIDRGEHGREVDRATAQQDLDGADSELAKSKAETLAETKPLQDRRAWAAARVEASTRSTPR
jgi:F0F1-type ATP synthase epsilon subunit